MVQRRALNEPDKNSKIQQQTLAAWYPIRSTQCVILTFFLMSILCIVLGVCIIVIGNENVIEYEKRYDNVHCDDNPAKFAGCKKTIQLTTRTILKPPVFLYYKLVDFYQNHRTYASSEKMIKASVFNDTISVNSVSNGLTAYSLELQSPPHIVWDSDYNRFPTAKDNIEKQREIVWRRVAAMPTFKKLYAVYSRVLKGGQMIDHLPSKSDITIQVIDEFNAAKGEKWLVISTTSRLGGTQYFLAWSFIFVGAVMLTVALLMSCMSYISTSDHEKYFIQ